MMFSANAREDGLQRREHRLVRADHDVQPALLGLDRRARQRRIDEGDALLRERFARLRGRPRLRGRRVDDDQPVARGRHEPVGAEHDLLDLRRAGHAQEHDVGVARDVGIARDFLRARGQQILERLAVAVRAHRQRKPLVTRFFAMP